MTFMFPPRGGLRAALGLALTLAASLALVLACPTRSHAQNLVLVNLVVDNQAGDILVRFGVDVEGTDKVAAMLREGESLELRCHVSLTRTRAMWLNKPLASADLALALRHDPLSKRYVAETPGGGPPMTHTELAMLLSQAWSEIAMHLGSWHELSRGRKYGLMLEIRLDRLDVPVWLKRSLFFWNWEAAPATHYQLEFTY